MQLRADGGRGLHWMKALVPDSWIQQQLPPWRAVWALVAIGLIFALGSYIPLPGIDLDSIPGGWAYSNGDVMARLSIFALGIIPLFTVLVYAELAKLIVPPLARWEASSNAFAVVICVCALLLTAVQGYGALVGLAASTTSLIRTNAVAFIPVGLATFVGSTAVIVWLCGAVKLPGLRDSFWLLMAVVYLSALPASLMPMIEFVRIGAGSIWSLALVIGMAAISIAAAVLAHNIWTHMRGSAVSPAILLWPPFLAATLAGYGIGLLSVVAPGWMYAAPIIIDIAYAAITAVLIPAFIYLYVRQAGLRITRARVLALLSIATIQILVYSVLPLLPIHLGFPADIDGGGLLVMSTVILLLRRG